MNKVLSQDEVDALLRGVQSGEIDTAAESGGTEGIKSFDLASQERIIRGRMPGLEMANERFARFFRNSLSSVIMKFVDVNVHGIEMMKFSEFMKTIPMPSSINIFRMEPLKGYSLFVIEAPMVFAFIEHFFGGTSAKFVKSEGRYFTLIEQRIIKKLVATALRDMSEAWKAIVPVTAEHTGSEMNPQFVTIVTPTEVVVKVEIHVEVEDFLGKLFFCIPYSMVEPVKEKLYSGIQGERFETDQRWVSRLKEILMDSYVHLVAEMGRTELTVRDLMHMEIGDVLILGKSTQENIAVRVEEITKFKASPGLSRGNQAIKITGFV